jgi:ABC-type branched-subunit amino acid transport system substrate-binding protein
MKRPLILKVFLAASASILVVGCGGGGGGGGGGTATGSSNGSAKGTPVKVGVIAPTGTAGENYPEVLASATAAAMAINKAGGIQGHPIQIDYCNEQADANAGPACARTLVSDGVVIADATTSVDNPQGVYDVLRAANIASVANNVDQAPDYTDPSVYPIDSGSPGAFFACGALAPSPTHAKSAASLHYSLTASVTSGDLFKRGMAASLTSVTGKADVIVPTPPAPFNPTAAVNQLKSVGLVGLALTAQQDEQFMQSYSQLGGKGAFCTDEISMSDAVLKGLGQSAKNYYGAAAFPPINAASANPGIKQYLGDMSAAKSAGVKDADINTLQTGLNAWIGMQVIKQVGDSLKGPITAASLYTAMKTAQMSVPGLLTSVDFGAPPKVASYPRIHNWTQELDRWNAGTGLFEVAVPPKELDVAALGK